MDKLWLQHYPKDVPHTIDPEQYPSLNDLFAESFQVFADRVAFSSFGTALSFRDVERLSLHLAGYFQTLGLAKGSRVAIMLPNVLQYPIALLATLRAGMVVVNTNPLYTADELTHQLNDAQAETIIVFSKFAQVLHQALPKLSTLKHIIITDMGDLFPWVKRHVVNIMVRLFVDRRFKQVLQPTITFCDALRIGSQNTLQPVSYQAEDIAFLQYTGGTTGVSKGAMLTHRNMVANVLQAASWIAPKHFNEADMIVTALPLYHIFSLTANCLTFFHLGVANTLIIDARATKSLLKQIHRMKPTAITGVNTLFVSFLNHSNFNPKDFAQMKVVLSGGMALSLAIAERWRSVVGSPIVEAYGLTEASPAVAINLLSEDTHQGSIGLPLPSTDIAIRNEHGEDCKLGDIGELCILGPQVMKGYWQQTDETANVFWADKYLRTGDSVRMDEQGFIYLVDRLKEMIIVSGFNVYPNEVEQVIAQMPQVREVGVIGVMSKSGNEQIKACVVSTDPALTAEDIIAYCRLHLTGYKIPKIVSFYPELPKTNVGKVLRRMLK